MFSVPGSTPGTALLLTPLSLSLSPSHPQSPNVKKFDDTIRRRDQSFGLRDLSEVVTVADENGFELVEQIPMPSNNLMLCFKPKSGVGTAASETRLA